MEILSLKGALGTMQRYAASPGPYLVHHPVRRHPARPRTRAREDFTGSNEVQAHWRNILGLPAMRD
jgi:hypothetical protein